MHSTGVETEFVFSQLAVPNFQITVEYALSLQRKLSGQDQKGLALLNDVFRRELIDFRGEILLPLLLVQLGGDTSRIYECQNHLILAMDIGIQDWLGFYRYLDIESDPIVFGLVNVAHTWELWCMKQTEVRRQHECK
jgi:hypothetical protein